jgi:hypothetical protein
MSSNAFPTTDGGAADSPDADVETEDAAELAARIELLEAENRRLREEYARARRSNYRRTAFGMGAIGAVALLGALAFPANATVLVSLAAIGFFGALLTYYLTPERFVAATVGEGVYAATAENGDAIVGELGLSERRRYLPREAATREATLYVPQDGDDPLPDADALDSTFVVGEDGARGLALRPVGGALFTEFERALAGPLAGEPGPLADQLADGLTAEFELADAVVPDLEESGSGCAFGIDGSAFGAVDRFDHPIASFLAVGLAVGLDQPVDVEVTGGGDRFGHRVACSWEPDAEWVFGATVDAEDAAGDEARDAAGDDDVAAAGDDIEAADEPDEDSTTD